MNKHYSLICIFFLIFCTSKKQEISLHGIWQLCRVEDGKGDIESDMLIEKGLKEGLNMDQLEFTNDSVLVHRFKKGSEKKWNETKGFYSLSADKKKVITVNKKDSTTWATSILLLTEDSLKLQLFNKDIQVYFRKNH